jgi:hypothetical protein
MFDVRRRELRGHAWRARSRSACGVLIALDEHDAEP